MPKLRFPGPCGVCGRTEPSGYYTKKMCKNCYSTMKRRMKGITPGRKKEWDGPCIACGTMKSKGGFIKKMCRTCHRRISRGGSPTRRAKFNGPCRVCGVSDPKIKYIHKMCFNCYVRIRNGGNVIPRARYIGPCIVCGTNDSYTGRFYKKMCIACYMRLNGAHNRSVRKGNTNTLTEEQWKRVLEHHDYHCAYCGKDIRDGHTMDHVIPIFKGGDNAIHNVVPACRSCNSKKGANLFIGPLRVLYD